MCHGPAGSSCLFSRKQYKEKLRNELQSRYICLDQFDGAAYSGQIDVKKKKDAVKMTRLISPIDGNVKEQRDNKIVDVYTVCELIFNKRECVCVCVAHWA